MGRATRSTRRWAWWRRAEGDAATAPFEEMVDGLRALGFEVDRASFPMVVESHLAPWALARSSLDA